MLAQHIRSRFRANPPLEAFRVVNLMKDGRLMFEEAKQEYRQHDLAGH